MKRILAVNFLILAVLLLVVLVSLPSTAEKTPLGLNGPLKPHVVPDIIGMPSAEAFALIEKAKLGIFCVELISSDVHEPLTVISVSPSVGTKLKHGEMVVLEVADIGAG